MKEEVIDAYFRSDKEANCRKQQTDRQDFEWRENSDENPLKPHVADAPPNSYSDEEGGDHDFCAMKVFEQKARKKLK